MPVCAVKSNAIPRTMAVALETRTAGATIAEEWALHRARPMDVVSSTASPTKMVAECKETLACEVLKLRAVWLVAAVSSTA